MSGSLGGSKSDSSGSQSFNQDVWKPQGDALEKLYGSASGLFGQSIGKGGKGAANQMAGGTDFQNQTMSQMQPAFQNQLQGGAYKDMGLQDNLMSSLNQSLQGPSATQEINNMIMGGSGNNYADAMRNQFTQDATDAQNNMLRNLDSRAAASGMSGGSRHGLATAQGMKDINQNLQRNMANVGYNTFDKDLDRKLQIAGMADQGTLARQQMMSNMIGGQQNAMTGGLQSGQNMMDIGIGQQMMPWQQMGAYSNTIGGPQVLSSGAGSSNSNAKSLAGSGGK